MFTVCGRIKLLKSGQILIFFFLNLCCRAGDTFQQPELFEFDHVHPDSSIGNPITILYGSLGTECFKEFHHILMNAAREVYHPRLCLISISVLDKFSFLSPDALFI